MYLSTDDSYTYTDREGTQYHTQGDFLLLLTPEDASLVEEGHEAMRACIRQVALEQCGHYMMGNARIGGESFTVSGSYGSNGLTMNVPREIWKEYGVPVPEDLFEKWRTGGGHNSSGAEARDMQEWAEENYDRLTP